MSDKESWEVMQMENECFLYHGYIHRVRSKPNERNSKSIDIYWSLKISTTGHREGGSFNLVCLLVYFGAYIYCMVKLTRQRFGGFNHIEP